MDADSSSAPKLDVTEERKRALAAQATDGSLADFEAQVLGIKRLFDLGLIKHWGLSNENAYGVTMFCLAADKRGAASLPSTRVEACPAGSACRGPCASRTT